MREILVNDNGRTIAHADRFDDSDGLLVTVYSVPGGEDPLRGIAARYRYRCVRLYAENLVFRDRSAWPDGTHKAVFKVFDGCPNVDHECARADDVFAG